MFDHLLIQRNIILILWYSPRRCVGGDQNLLT